MNQTHLSQATGFGGSRLASLLISVRGFYSGLSKYSHERWWRWHRLFLVQHQRLIVDACQVGQPQRSTSAGLVRPVFVSIENEERIVHVCSLADNVDASLQEPGSCWEHWSRCPDPRFGHVYPILVVVAIFHSVFFMPDSFELQDAWEP